MPFHYLLTFFISVNFSAVLLFSSLKNLNVYPLLSAFGCFSSSLVFRQLIIMCPDVLFFVFSLLWICRVSWICNLMIFVSLENSYPLLKYWLYVIVSVLYFWYSECTYIRHFHCLVSLTVSPVFCSLLYSVCQFGHLLLTCIPVQWSLVLLARPLVNPSTKCLISVILFFNFRI